MQGAVYAGPVVVPKVADLRATRTRPWFTAGVRGKMPSPALVRIVGGAVLLKNKDNRSPLREIRGTSPY